MWYIIFMSFKYKYIYMSINMCKCEGVCMYMFF